MMNDLVASRTARFVLVHGTWGRGFFSKWIEPRTVASDDAARPVTLSKRLRWFDTGSDFRIELANALKSRQLSFTTRVFLWDGANSIASRNKADENLATQLEELAIEHPNDPIVIVAHSHGGNVALRAAHIAVNAPIENLRVITIATPFLQIRTYSSFYESGVGYGTPYSKTVISFLVGTIATFLSILISVLAIIFLGTSSNSWSLFGWVCAYLLLGYVIARHLVKLVANPFPTYKWSWGWSDSSPEGWAYKPDRLASLSYYSVPRTDRDWLLVLRGTDDEASLSLAAGAISNRITHLILGSVLPNLVAMLALAMLISLPFVSFAGGGWLHLGFLLYFWACITATLIIFLPGCFRSVFGRELLLGCWRCEILADSTPDTDAGVRVKTFLRAGSEGGGLKHALYKNPEIAPYIAAWLAASVQGKKELAD